MHAVLLIDRHLVLFEVEISDALLEYSNEELARELVLVGKASARDGFQPAKEGLVGPVTHGDGVERVVAKLIVIAVVTEGRGALGKVTEIRFVLLFEKRVLGFDAVGDWFDVLGKGRTGKDQTG